MYEYNVVSIRGGSISFDIALENKANEMAKKGWRYKETARVFPPECLAGEIKAVMVFEREKE